MRTRGAAKREREETEEPSVELPVVIPTKKHKASTSVKAAAVGPKTTKKRKIEKPVNVTKQAKQSVVEASVESSAESDTPPEDIPVTALAALSVTETASTKAFSAQKIVEAILDAIERQRLVGFYGAGKKEFAILARVNKFISPLALRRLWKRLDEFDNLLNLLPKDLIKIPAVDWITDAGDILDGKCKQLRKAGPWDLGRYLYYCSFIEEIDFLSDDWPLKNGSVEMVADFIHSTHNSKSHLTNLKELAVPIISWPHITNFIDYFHYSPLETLEIFGERVYTWSEEVDTFSGAIPKLFPKLQNLRISGRMPIDGRSFVEALKPGLLRGYRKLELLDLEITPNALEYILDGGINGSRSLKSLRLNIVEGDNEEDPSEEEDSEEDEDGRNPYFFPGPGLMGFLAPARPPKVMKYAKPSKSFKRLVLTSDQPEHFIEALNHVQNNKIQLENLGLLVRESMNSTQITKIIKKLVDSCPKMTILNINDTDADEEQEPWFEEAIEDNTLDQYTVSHADLKLLAKLKHLKTLNLLTTAAAVVTSDILDLFAKSCPNLEYCSLTPSNRITNNATKTLKYATLQDVINFVGKLPKLDHLCLTFDARKTKSASAAQAAVSIVLQELNVGSSFISDASYATELIRAAFPLLQSLEMEEYENAKMVRMSVDEDALWKEVKKAVEASSS